MKRRCDTVGRLRKTAILGVIFGTLVLGGCSGEAASSDSGAGTSVAGTSVGNLSAAGSETAGSAADEAAIGTAAGSAESGSAESGNAVEAGAERVIPSEGMAVIYEPDSGIVNPPTVIQRVTETLPESSGRTPSVVLMEIDADLNILGIDGNVISTAADFMIGCSQAVIPAFIIDSGDEGDALAGFLSENKIIDAFVVADGSNAELVKQVRDVCTSVRGALIFDSLDTVEKRQEARKLVHENKSFVAVSRAPMDIDTVSYFNVRQISSWSIADNTAEVYRAIANGYSGVITDDAASVYDVYESIDTPTVSGQPVIIAHRGAHLDTPENTIMGFHEAQDTYGVLAVETDIRVTSDGVVYMMHDKNVDRTTDGSGKGSDMTWEQLDALVIDEKAEYGQDRISEIPRWEEVMEEFKDSDLVFYCHNKTTSSTQVELFCRLIDEYDFGDHIVFFNGFNDRTRYNADNEIMPEGITFTAGDYPMVYARAKSELDAVASFVKQLAPNNHQPLFYSYGDFGTESFYYQMAARGFINSHSITNGQDVLDITLLTGMGAVGLLTDELNHTDDYHYYVEAADETVEVGTAIDLTKKVRKTVGTEDVVCGLIQIDGPELSVSDGSYALNEAGTVTVVFYADRTAEGGSAYRVYSEPVTITFAPAV